MNKYQRLIIIVAAMNVLLMLLFPPFANQPLAKGMIPGLQGFYPVFMQFGKQPVFSELLTLELMFVAINTLTASGRYGNAFQLRVLVCDFSGNKVADVLCAPAASTLDT